MYDIAIIGGGPAGLSAGVYAARGGAKCCILEEVAYGGQVNQIDHIDNYLGMNGESGMELAEKFSEHAKQHGVEFIRRKVKSVELDGDVKVIHTSRIDVQAKNIIIATGAKPRKSGLEAEERFAGNGVSYCATCDGAFYKDKTVAIIGGGDTALSDALYLSRIANKIYLIHRRDEFRGAKSLQDKIRDCDNIECLMNAKLEDIYGENSVAGIVVNGEKISVDGVFMAIGTQPNNELFVNKVELDKNGYIITDSKMKTSVSGVYAVGDIRNTPLRQVITAVADGAVAAFDALENI